MHDVSSRVRRQSPSGCVIDGDAHSRTDSSLYRQRLKPKLDMDPRTMLEHV